MKMSLFLEDVLGSEELKKLDLSAKIDYVKLKIIESKSEINKFMKDKFIELEPYIEPDELLIKNTEDLANEIKDLSFHVDNKMLTKLSSSSREIQNLSSDLKACNYSIIIANQLIEIRRCLDSIEIYKHNQDKCYSMAANTLIKLKNLTDNNVDIRHLRIYESIMAEFQRLHNNFSSELSRLWHEKVCWMNEAESLNKDSMIVLHIFCDTLELTDIFQAFSNLDRLTPYIEVLSSKLFQHFINPIIHFKCNVQSNDKMFSIDILDKKQSPAFIDVFQNLQELFVFLNQHFQINLENEEHVMSKISIPLLEKFAFTLTNDCVSKVIPTSTSELEAFETFVNEIEKFQDYLLEIKFINDEQKFLSKYTNNIDKLYIDKKCEKLLALARIIMKKDLHDSFKYQTPEIKNIFSNVEELNDENSKLSKSTFLFPDCQISKSAQEILDLVDEILEEACHCSNKYVPRLFYTSRNIFEMYAHLVPQIHKSFLETIPQQVALFHNSCIYLSHNLLILLSKYKYKIPGGTNFSFMYVDQSLLLRQVGTQYFLSHMKYQRDIIFDILRESGLSSIGQMSELPINTERALRQCIRQLELLKTVWIEILPVKVYCRAIGCIVNDMVDDICFKVISVEDISADIALELVILFNMVVARVPQIFPDSQLIEKHVKKWRKLKELIIILGASLKEIEERWFGGPLAMEFTPQNIKQLIRALFQNTERRSNLLSKIKDK